MSIKKIKQNKGFVILFAVTISAIILAIALGVASVALKEVKFGTSAKDTNNSFFAADTGAECALYYDSSAGNRFSFPDPGGVMNCAGSAITPTATGNLSVWSYDFIIPAMSSGGCAKVNIKKDKTINPPATVTTVTSNGYNFGDAVCASSNPNRIEREIIVNY